jgi:hypothetical protein
MSFSWIVKTGIVETGIVETGIVETDGTDDQTGDKRAQKNLPKGRCGHWRG